jgi:hypothetical protein
MTGDNDHYGNGFQITRKNRHAVLSIVPARSDLYSKTAIFDMFYAATQHWFLLALKLRFGLQIIVMEHLFDLLIIAPIWGMLSGQFFTQSCLSFICCLIHTSGIFCSKVPRPENSAGALGNLLSLIIFPPLLFAGSWLFLKFFMHTTGEKICYWSFFVFSVWYCLDQAYAKVIRSWLCAYRPGYVANERMEKAYKAALSWGDNAAKKYDA